MFIDARGIPDGIDIDVDLCIVGAGAAGITLGSEFAGSALRVALLESGGLVPDVPTQALYEGQNVGREYFPLSSTRLRFFGGTTNHWTGQCQPLDELDFQPRLWVPMSGWPFERTQLEPFYLRAQVKCEVGPYDFRPDSWETPNATRLNLDASRVRTAMIQNSPPTRFGSVFREQIGGARNIDTYLNANAVEFVVTETASSVRHVRVVTLGGNTFRLRAGAFVLATGGIENARLLLASNSVQREGLGNGRDLVGRCFMEHIVVPGGLFAPANPRWRRGIYERFVRHPETGTLAVGRLALAPEVHAQERLLNVHTSIREAAWLAALEATTPGIESARELVGSSSSSASVAENLRDIVGDIEGITMYAYRRLFRPSARAYWLVNQIEQAPNLASRVVLSTERDALGQRRADLDWQLTELEQFTYRTASRIVAEELGRAGAGRVRQLILDSQTGWPELPSRERGARHHIGTTRMHRNPSSGVVNENARVHGVSNLYIAGSSVFPTSGDAGPTFTIVALAIRLADHLKAQLA